MSLHEILGLYKKKKALKSFFNDHLANKLIQADLSQVYPSLSKSIRIYPCLSESIRGDFDKFIIFAHDISIMK